MKLRAWQVVLVLSGLAALVWVASGRPAADAEPASSRVDAPARPGAIGPVIDSGPPEGIDPRVVPTVTREVEPRIEYAPGVLQLLPGLTYDMPPPKTRKTRTAPPSAPTHPGGIGDEPLPVTIQGEFGFGWESLDSTATSSFPADPHGAVGPNHVMNVVNTSFRIYDKQGALQSSGTLFSLFSPLATGGVFDPRVLYDKIHDRFVVIVLDQSFSVDSAVLAAVSDDDNPMGTWYIQEVPAYQNLSGDTWADFPSLGVGDEAVYVTTNQFTNSDPAFFRNSQVFTLAKGVGTGGWYDGGTATVTKFNPTGDLANNSLHAAELVGTHPDATFGNFFAAYNGAESAGHKVVRLFTLRNPLTTPLLTLELVNIGNPDSGTAPPNAPQPSGVQALETDKRKITDAVWRDDRLYLTTTLRVGTEATAHWFKMNTTTVSSTFLEAQGNIDGEDIAVGAHTFYPSVAVASNGDMGIGFSASGTTLFPGSYFTYRFATGLIQPAQPVREGNSVYLRVFDGRNRWGDYSGIGIDPVDDCFWAYNKFAKTVSVWGTSWSKFCLDFECGDGNLEPGESCDPPGLPAGQPDECRADCFFCSDGALQPAFEDCDDGNNIAGDGCGPNCFYELCGNGVVQLGEECDAGGVESGAPDDCRFDCTFCGDNNLDTATSGDIAINGGFDLGVFHAWDVLADGNGDFFIDEPATTTPLSGLTTRGGFGAGSFYAVSDSNGLGRHGIQQTFTVPSYATGVTLKFDLFANSYASPVIDPAGLEWDIFPNQNQHARVDLLNPGFPDFDTSPAAVVATYYIGADAGSNPNFFTRNSIDITGDVVPGQTYVVRFAEATNQAVLNLGVNLVGVDVTQAVPEECDDGNNVGGDTCSSTCRLCTTAPFDETVFALDEDTFVWGSPRDAFFAIGDLADVASYSPTSTGSAAFVTSVDVTQTVNPGDGIYFVIRPDCPGASWSSGGDGQCCPRPLP